MSSIASLSIETIITNDNGRIDVIGSNEDIYGIHSRITIRRKYILAIRLNC